jgi:hypothetical protein
MARGAFQIIYFEEITILPILVLTHGRIVRCKDLLIVRCKDLLFKH